jgi:hypothetical protein
MRCLQPGAQISGKGELPLMLGEHCLEFLIKVSIILVRSGRHHVHPLESLCIRGLSKDPPLPQTETPAYLASLSMLLPTH